MSEESRQDAVALLERMVDQDPASPLYLTLAERLREQGRVDEAIRLCEERRSRPGRVVGDHIVLGRAYLAAGRLPEARGQFEAALRLDRENVAALKALAGIESHEGRHAAAADLYRAVCRVDPGDLESQTALHQITSGEFPEVRPPDLVLGQGEVVWQPVRLPREEENLPELALGLRTIETFDAEPPRATEVHVQDFREVRLESLEIELDAEAPLDSSAVDSALASVTAEPTPAPPRGPIVAPPREPVPPRTPAPPPREARHAPLPDAPPQPVPAPVREPAIDTVPTAVGESALGSEPAAVGEPALDPESSSSRGAPGRPVEGNRSAFETWVRRLGSWEHR